MSLWPSEEPSDPNALRAHREYWIQGAPTRGKRRRPRWWWIVGGTAFLGLGLGAVYHWPLHPTQVAGPATTVTAGKASSPERAPITVPASQPTPKLVVGLHPVAEPPEQQGVDHAQAPNSAPEPHYTVGLRPITEPVQPPPDPVVVAMPSEVPPVTPPVEVKPSRKRALPGPSTHPTAGQVRF
jgi:hypothetical protein